MMGELTRRGQGVVAMFIAAIVLAILYIARPAPIGYGPWYNCVESTAHDSWDCYRTGDVPEGSKIVWSGPESEIPRQ